MASSGLRQKQFSIKGRITQFGTSVCDRNNFGYAWIEFEDESGRRIHVTGVAVSNAVASLLLSCNVGEYYFEQTAKLKWLFGIKGADGRNACDHDTGVLTRKKRVVIGVALILLGLPLLILNGIGVAPILFGFWIMFGSVASRETFFYGSDQQEAARIRNQEVVRI